MSLLFSSASPYPSSEEIWTTAFSELSRRIKRYLGGKSLTIERKRMCKD